MLVAGCWIVKGFYFNPGSRIQYRSALSNWEWAVLILRFKAELRLTCFETVITRT